jgi:hypothetical protein
MSNFKFLQAFQSGREYSKHGQRIALGTVANHLVFVDIDRGINGAFTMPDLEFISNLNMQNWFMSQYDAGGYMWIPEFTSDIKAELEREAGKL